MHQWCLGLRLVGGFDVFEKVLKLLPFYFDAGESDRGFHDRHLQLKICLGVITERNFKLRVILDRVSICSG